MSNLEKNERTEKKKKVIDRYLQEKKPTRRERMTGRKERMSFTYTRTLQMDTISLHLIFIYPRFFYFFLFCKKTDVKERESAHLFIHRRVFLVHTTTITTTLYPAPFRSIPSILSSS